LDWALRGGEDFELAFTVPPQQQQAFESALKDHLVPCTQVGQITKDGGLQLQQPDGSLTACTKDGYRHF
ncbi:MAG: thiamine-phosphate kinase, partial [Motiliproteus sp.]|nr:thiamine-phosphate kinase [Motiliproteus sp.]